MPFDSVINAVNAANTRLNGRVDTLQPTGGQLVGNTNSFSQQVVNDGWRKMQNRLADLRYSGIQGEAVFSNVPPAFGVDPATQVSIGYSGYYNGSTTVGSPALPADLIRPYELTERTSGSGALFTEMDPIPWSLPRVPKMQRNGQWLWRNNAIYMPGSLVPTDISLLYGQLLGDFVDGSVPWFQQPMPILNCTDSLADYICREIAIARGDMAAALAFQQSAEDNALLIVNRDTTGGKSIAKYSEYQKMSDRYTPSVGPDAATVKR